MFTLEQEKAFANRIKLLADLSYGLTSQEVTRVAFEFAQTNNFPHKFSNEIMLGGKGFVSWFYEKKPYQEVSGKYQEV